jgi:dCTP deaminase
MHKKMGIISGKDLIEQIENKDNDEKNKSLITCERWEKCQEKTDNGDIRGRECKECSSGLDWNNFNGWQVDLNLGKEAYITGNKSPTILDENNQYLTIEPGDFALLETEEDINVPSNLMGFISVRFKYKKMGLVNISGFHVDPGYKGKLIFSVYNAGPDDIIMKKGTPVFMIFFLTLTQDLSELEKDIRNDDEDYIPESLKEVINGKNNYFTDKDGFKSIPLELISMIQGSSVSLAKNNNRIEKLESSIKIYGSIAGGIIIALIGTLFAIGIR